MAPVYIKEFLHERIQHVYGQLYDTKELEKDCYGEFSKSKDSSIQRNTGWLLKAIRSSGKIKVIYDQRNSEPHLSNIRRVLKSAEEVIIIGFGFDRENLTILGFPELKAKYEEFLLGKKIKYMDYKGRMNSLYAQFKEIEIRYNGSIIRSEATKIIDAYQNDFKIYLYQ